MAKVTFTNNVYPYVKGDTVELSKDDLKKVDAYVKRWNIKDAYTTEGGSKSAAPKSEPKSTAKTSKQNKTATTQTGEGDTPENSTQTPSDENDEGKEQETEPAVDGVEDKGNPATEGDGENPEVTGEDSDTQGQGDTPGEASDNANASDKK